MSTLSSRSDRAWAATRKGLFELSRGPDDDRWSIDRLSFAGEPVSMVLPPGEGVPLLAALNLGHFGVKLHASWDEGRHWDEVAAPAFSPQPEGAAGPPWNVVQIWSLEAAHGTVWAGTLPGALFRSADGGCTWRLVESLWQLPERLEWNGGGYDVPGIHSICPHPERAGELLVAVSTGGVWVSRDDGASWTVRASGMRAAYMPPERQDDPVAQDAHRVVRCAGAPEVLWCQHHSGIWRSKDDAASWQEVTTAPLSSFGFAVAVHPHDPDCAWFVPAQADERRIPVGAALAVNRTRDGGRGFTTARTGLPQSHCYDLVYRHGLVVSDDGEHLLMGSTTGGLWSSSDGGNTWQGVSQNLPPIYALRFG